MNYQAGSKTVEFTITVNEDDLRAATLIAMERLKKPVMLPHEVGTYTFAALLESANQPASAPSALVGKPFDWLSDGWVLELPPGSLLSLTYKGTTYVAEVDENGDLKYQGKSTTPGDFVRGIAGTSRHPRAVLKAKRPGDSEFKPVRELFATDAKKATYKPVQQPGPDILYKDFLAALDQLEALKNFPDGEFRRMHHTGSSIQGMRQYAEVGIQAGNNRARCKYDSRNGRVFRRVQEVLRHANSSMNEAEMGKLVDDAIEAVPFLD